MSRETRRCHSEASLEAAGHGWLAWTDLAFACNLQAIDVSSLGQGPLAQRDQKC